MVEDRAGNWWMLCLGVRPLGSLLHNLGRETFLAPVSWDMEGWPIVGNGGMLELEMDGPLPGAEIASCHVVGATFTGWHDDFRGPMLSREWSFLRRRPEGVALAGVRGGLLLEGGEVGLSDEAATPVFVGRPQPAFDCFFSVVLDFEPDNKEGAEAGITAYYDDCYHYEAFVGRRSGRRAVCLRKTVHDICVEESPVFLPEKGMVRLNISADRVRYSFSCEYGGDLFRLGSGMTAGLCTEGTWRQTFTGVFFGLYCRQGRALFVDACCVDRDKGR
jgi:alpha-N-arabinofuranosidase